MSNGKNNEKDTLDLRVKKDLPKEGVELSDEKLDGVAGGMTTVYGRDLSQEERDMVRNRTCPKCGREIYYNDNVTAGICFDCEVHYYLAKWQ